MYCHCSLTGRTHYARRCPLCGRYRDGARLHLWDGPESQIAAQLRQQAAERAQARRRWALDHLAAIEQLCGAVVPAPPVARRPRDLPEGSWAERAWERRAASWESWQRSRIEDMLREPFRLREALISFPAAARYRRVADRLIESYRLRLVEAGWSSAKSW